MHAPKTKRGALIAALAVTVFVFAGVIVAKAFAQASCYQQMCGGGEPYYGGDDGAYIVCNSGPGIGGSLDHTINPCPSGTTLVPHSGYCRLNSCAGGGAGCEETGICTDPQWPYYLPGSDDASRNSAACGTRPQFFTNAMAHIVVPCPTGFSLVPGVGVCRRCPTVRNPSNLGGGLVPFHPQLTLRPDLVIRNSWLTTRTSPAHVTTLHRGTPYFACFTVANIGAVASGNFRVGAGGLGVPVAPYQDHAGLAAGASRDGCIPYATTPGPGAYNLGLTADSLHAVAESREDNNDAVIHVIVTP